MSNVTHQNDDEARRGGSSPSLSLAASPAQLKGQQNILIIKKVIYLSLSNSNEWGFEGEGHEDEYTMARVASTKHTARSHRNATARNIVISIRY